MPGASAADGSATIARALRHAADLLEAGHVDDGLCQAESAIAEPLAERFGGHDLPADAVQVRSDAALGQRVTRVRSGDALVTVSRPRDCPALTVAMTLDAAGAACGADRYVGGVDDV